MAGKKTHIKRSRVHRSLLHNSHSGRLVHHKHTHYPTVLFFLLLCGVFLTASTAVTRAATLEVKATVLGQPPPYAAQITKPTDGQRFKSFPVDVEGTCPLKSIVKIYRNDFFSGSAICTTDNKFSLMIDLFEDKNTLVARVFNYANVEGPESDHIDVYYDKPAGAPPVKSPPGSGGSGEPILQLFLDSDTKFRGFHTNEVIKWPVEVGGGLAPYAIAVNWGDDNSDVLSVKKAGEFNISHTYSEPGGNDGAYAVILKASDNQNAKAYLQIAIVVNDLKTATETFGTGTLDYFNDAYNKVLMMWPVYATALLMTISFWLGQRRGYNLLPRTKRTRRAH